jgi:hypothetical protein
MNRMIALVVLVCSLPASAVVVYEPVQYQFAQPGGYYYYGGTDPAVHQLANRYIDLRIHRDAEGMVSDKPARVYSDSMPRLNAALYGWTANDAKNEAYASIPRYFRKADLLRNAHIDCSGSLIVPARSPATHGCGTIEIKPWKGYKSVATPKPIMIVPKSELNLDAPLTLPEGTPSKA